LRIAELFYSIQGEGSLVGVPSFFIRTSGCNLRCSWCDTPYTSWQPEGVEMGLDRILDEVRAHPTRHVVVTGGEPLIQRRQIAPFVSALKGQGFRFEIETNGTVLPGELGDLIDQWNVSPKLRNSGNEGLERMPEAALRDFAARGNAFFKFVVCDPGDLEEVEEFRARFDVPPIRVVLMPEGTTAAALNARSPWLAEICAERGYRFSSRLHILIWGDKRGV